MGTINTTKSCPPGEWTQINTAALVTTGEITVSLVSGPAVWLQATTDTTTPTNEFGPLALYYPGNGWSESTLAAKFKGVGDGTNAAYLWAKPVGGDASLVGMSAQTV